MKFESVRDSIDIEIEAERLDMMGGFGGGPTVVAITVKMWDGSTRRFSVSPMVDGRGRVSCEIATNTKDGSRRKSVTSVKLP